MVMLVPFCWAVRDPIDPVWIVSTRRRLSDRLEHVEEVAQGKILAADPLDEQGRLRDAQHRPLWPRL